VINFGDEPALRQSDSRFNAELSGDFARRIKLHSGHSAMAQFVGQLRDTLQMCDANYLDIERVRIFAWMRPAASFVVWSKLRLTKRGLSI
jgi:hypothetical protein